MLRAGAGDRFAGFLAIAVGAIIDARQRLVDLGDQLALAITRPQLDGTVGFGGSAVGKIGIVLVFLLEMLQRLLGFACEYLPASRAASRENVRAGARS